MPSTPANPSETRVQVNWMQLYSRTFGDEGITEPAKAMIIQAYFFLQQSNQQIRTLLNDDGSLTLPNKVDGTRTGATFTDTELRYFRNLFAKTVLEEGVVDSAAVSNQELSGTGIGTQIDYDGVFPGDEKAIVEAFVDYDFNTETDQEQFLAVWNHIQECIAKADQGFQRLIALCIETPGESQTPNPQPYIP